MSISEKRKTNYFANYRVGFVWVRLERETGFEPATSTLARLRSTN